jgi:uncharacterized protein YpmS
MNARTDQRKNMQAWGVTAYIAINILTIVSLGFFLIMLMVSATDTKMIYQLKNAEQYATIAFIVEMVLLCVGLVFKETSLVTRENEYDARKQILSWLIAFFVALNILTVVVFCFSLLMLMVASTDQKMLYQLENGEIYAAIAYVMEMFLIGLALIVKESRFVAILSDEEFKPRETILTWAISFFIALNIPSVVVFGFSLIELTVSSTNPLLLYQLNNAKFFASAAFALEIVHIFLVLAMKDTRWVVRN